MINAVKPKQKLSISAIDTSVHACYDEADKKKGICGCFFF